MTFPSVYLSLRIRHLTRMRVVGVTQIGNTKCVRCLCCKSTSYASRICPLNGDFSDCYLNAEWRGRSCVEVSKIRVSGFRRNLGCARYTQSWVFFQNFQNTALLLLYYPASKKTIEMVFTWGDRGYSAVRFEYKTPLSNIWLLWYKQTVLGVFGKKLEFDPYDLEKP